METVRNEGAKKSFFVPLIIVLVLIILVLLFLISPLSNMLFPPDTEPTLALSVVEKIGPDPATGLYRVVVEAEVEGKPEPQVNFNRNDGVGEVKDYHTLLLLKEEETFLLKALASNPRGTAEAELELFGGIMVGTSTGPPVGPGGSPGPGGSGDDDDDDEEAPPPAGNGGTGNRAPVISAAAQGRSFITNFDASLTINHDQERYEFQVLAVDEDGDMLVFDVEASHGRIIESETVRMESPDDPDRVVFTWEYSDVLREEQNVQFAVTVRDPSGASDRKILKVTLLPAPGAAGGDPGEARLVRSGAASVTASADLSGSVNSAGDVVLADIMVGDDLHNRQLKGFLNFYLITLRDQITDITGGRDYTITDAYLVFANINKVGNPESLANLVDFKVFPYGSSLVAADFAPGGSHIFNCATANFLTPGGRPLILRSSTFKTELINYINARSRTMQIKLGLNRTTNNNNVEDMFIFNCGTVNIVVEFEY